MEAKNQCFLIGTLLPKSKQKYIKIKYICTSLGKISLLFHYAKNTVRDRNALQVLDYMKLIKQEK